MPLGPGRRRTGGQGFGMPTDDVDVTGVAQGAAGSGEPPTRRQPDGANMSAQAYRAISNKIKSRELRGGDTLVEQRLAEQLGVSRTPLREAMQRLEGEGLLLKAANRGSAAM